MHRFLSLSVLSLSIVLAGCSKSESPVPDYEPTPQEERLAGLIAERLQVAPDVAWSKYLSDDPVHDPERETELLKSLTEQAEPHGLGSAFVESLFDAQFRASRQWQRLRIEDWRRGEELPAGEAPDLREDIRPQLNRISVELMEVLAPFQDGGRPGFRAWCIHWLSEQGIPRAVAETATQPFAF